MESLIWLGAHGLSIRIIGQHFEETLRKHRQYYLRLSIILVTYVL